MNTYEFYAYNQESVYGYGTDDEAEAYLEVLNGDAEVNLYFCEITELTEEQAENWCVNLQDQV